MVLEIIGETIQGSVTSKGKIITFKHLSLELPLNSVYKRLDANDESSRNHISLQELLQKKFKGCISNVRILVLYYIIMFVSRHGMNLQLNLHLN